MGMKTEEPQDTQKVFTDTRLGHPDKADPPGQQVWQATQRVDHRAIGPGVKLSLIHI